jgi:two-component system, cell cycle sensor histidine kinase and response regulator CckA
LASTAKAVPSQSEAVRQTNLPTGTNRLYLLEICTYQEGEHGFEETRGDSTHADAEIRPAGGAISPKSPMANSTPEASVVNAPATKEFAQNPRRKQAVEAIDSGLQAILEAIDGLGFVLNRQGKVLQIWASDNSEGSPPSESLLGKSIGVFFGDKALREMRPAWIRVLRTGKAENLIHVQTLGGRQVWHSSRLTPIRMPGGGRKQNICLFSRDITDCKLLEGRLAHAEKMEALGHLVGGISHDFNNILGVMQAASELLSSNLGVAHAQHKYVAQLLRSTESAAVLTQQLLAFSRQQVREPRISNLNDIVTDAAQLVHRVLGEDIAFSTILEPQLFCAMVDSNEIQRVIMNLVNNARDAMPKGGSISIETANAFLHEERFPNLLNAISGEYAVLDISDTGVGMDTETMAHIFEPFFTTKQNGKGTGLGLASVHGIVSQSGGFIKTASAPGKGTRFRIYLPAAAGQATAPPTALRTKIRATRSETVLLVEDSQELRTVLKEMLEASGLNVIAFPTAEGALQLIAERPVPVDLLITDVVMPGLSGQQLALQLQSICPKLRVLYMTGYSSASLKARGDAISPEHLLSKPFTQNMLLQRVAASLRGAKNLGEPVRKDADTNPQSYHRTVDQ